MQITLDTSYDCNQNLWLEDAEVRGGHKTSDHYKLIDSNTRVELDYVRELI